MRRGAASLRCALLCRSRRLASRFVCGTGGELYIWGENSYGQLGDGALTHRASPTVVEGLIGPVTAVSLGGVHSAAIAGVVCLFAHPADLHRGFGPPRAGPVLH